MNMKLLALAKAMGGGSGGGGVSSWNDLTDKPFGEEVSEVSIVSTDDFIGTNDNPANIATYSFLQIGNTYIVYFDEVRYECVCFDDDGYDTIGAPYGNFSKYPFNIYTDGSRTRCICADSNPHSASICTVDTVLVKIDPKFIPDPVVSWGSLTSKPMYKDKEIKEITWDGNAEGLTVFNTVYYKISDLTLTPEQLMWQTIHAVENGSDISYTVDDVLAEGDVALMPTANGAPTGVMVILDGSSVGTPNGVYFMKASDEVYTKSAEYLTTTDTAISTIFFSDAVVTKTKRPAIVPKFSIVNESFSKPYTANRNDFNVPLSAFSATGGDYYISIVATGEVSRSSTVFAGVTTERVPVKATYVTGSTSGNYLDLTPETPIAFAVNTASSNKYYGVESIYVYSSGTARVYFKNNSYLSSSGTFTGSIAFSIKVEKKDSKYSVAEAVPNATGEVPTSLEFNALLNALRNAGIIDTE